MKDYDRSIGFGICVSAASEFAAKVFYVQSFDDFKSDMDKDFLECELHLKNGYDIIVPYPTKRDLEGPNKMKYFKKDSKGKMVQIIQHNLGTGNASIPMNYLEYIQQKINGLKECASQVKWIKKYIMPGYRINSANQIVKIQQT